MRSFVGRTEMNGYRGNSLSCDDIHNTGVADRSMPVVNRALSISTSNHSVQC